MDMVFANRLREIRERSGMKRKEVAEKLGLACKLIRAMSKGNESLDLVTLLKCLKSSMSQSTCYACLIT